MVRSRRKGYDMGKKSEQETFRNRAIRWLAGYDFFISYVRSEASEFARNLELELRQKDYTCFFDQSEITAGEEFEQRIQKALNRSKVLLLVVSNQVSERPYVRFEVETFLNKRKPVCVPISFDGSASDLPWPTLRQINWIEASSKELTKGHPAKATLDAILNRANFIKRVWYVRSMVIAIICLLTAITVWALMERNTAQSRLAYSQRERARMELVTTKRRMRAAALLESAYLLDPDSYIGNVLFSDALRTMRSRLWSHKLDSLPMSLTLSGDTGDLVVMLADGTVQLRDHENGEVFWTVAENGQEKGPSVVDSKGNYIITSSLPEFTLEDFISSLTGHYSSRLWHINQKQQIAELLDGYTRPPDDIAVGNTAFATLSDDTVHVFSLAAGELIREISAPMSSDMVRISRDGDYVAVYTKSGSRYVLTIWSVASGKEVAGCNTTKEIEHIIFTLSSDAVIFSTDDGTIHAWDIEKNSSRFSVSAHRRSVTGLALTAADSNLLASASWDSSIRLWNLQSGKLVRTLSGHTDKVSRIRYSADGTLLVSTGQEGFVIVWDVAAGTPLLIVDNRQGEVLDALLTDDNRYLYTCGADKALAKWDVARASALVRLPQSGARRSSPYLSSYGEIGVHLDADGIPVLVHSPPGDSVQLIDHSTKSLIGIAIDNNLSLLAGRDGDGKAALWDTRSGKKKITLQEEGPRKNIHLFAFAPSGEVLAGIYRDGYCRIWDTTTGEIVRQAQMHYDLSDFNRRLRLSSKLVFSPEGSLLMSGALSINPFVWRWQEKDAQPQGLESKNKQYGNFVAPIGMTNGLAFSRQGDLLAIGGRDDDPFLHLWQVTQDNGIVSKKVLNAHSMYVRCLAFNNIGSFLASGSRDGSVKIWHTGTGGLQTSLDNHRAEVTSIVFHPTENLIASGASDGTVRLWDIAAGDVLLQRRYHTDKVLQLEFSRNGNVLFSSSEDGRIIQWDLNQELPDEKHIKQLMDQQATWRVVNELLAPQITL